MQNSSVDRESCQAKERTCQWNRHPMAHELAFAGFPYRKLFGAQLEVLFVLIDVAHK